MICKNCNQEVKKKRNKFCNRSCAVSFNNRQRIYKFKWNNCEKCGKELERKSHNDRRKLCDNCNDQIINWSKVLYKDVRGSRKYQKNSRIRELARKIFMRSNIPKKCKSCGYSKHIEVCHIKGISEHNDNTPISEINKLSNLIGLCRNCHWELDYGNSSLMNLIGDNF